MKYFNRLSEAKKHIDSGKSIKETAKTMGIEIDTVRRYISEINLSFPEIWTFDIETLPHEVFTFHLGEQRIPHDHVKKDWSIVCWSAKKLFSPKIISAMVTPKEAINRQDASIITKLWDLFDTADILIAHNCDAFDVKRSNARFLANGLNPPMPYQTIDTLKISRKSFGQSSHKLDYLTRLFFSKRKIKTDFDLWVECCEGNQKAMNKMLKYNKEDVRLLEEVYLELRPWITSHPNLGLYVDAKKPVCPKCLNSNLDWKGKYYTPAGRFKAFRCPCGSIGRSRFSDLSAAERKHLTVSVAR